MRIPVSGTKGRLGWVLIDDEDFPRLPKGLRLDKRGRPIAQIYAGRRNGRSRFREVQLGRWILGVDDPSLEVDHMNRDPLDNRRSNLRTLPRGGNSQNMSPHADSTSQYRGVCWDKRKGKWKATARINGRLMNLGHYDDEAEAGNVACAYRLEYMQYATD